MKNDQHPQTISDIAKLAEVSTATVSRVINNSGYVGDKTRKRIEDIIQISGFTPNRSAQSLVKRKTHLIGLIIPSFDNPVYLEILKGVDSAAVEKGYSVILSQSGEDPENIEESMHHLAALQVDGIVITKPEVHNVDLSNYMRPFIRGKIPIVRIGEPNEELMIESVSENAHESGRLAGEHLASQGFDRIGIIGTPINPFVKQRVEGVQTALLNKGISPENILYYDADFTQAGGYKAACNVFSDPNRPSALITLNDIMAIGVIMAAEDKGVKIPEEIALMGIDGINLGTTVRPKLSTVVLPRFEMGKHLFNLLYSRLSGEYSGEVRMITVHGRMVTRESSMHIIKR